MTAIIGNFALCAAVLAAIATVLVSVRAVRTGSQGLRRTARRGIYLLAGLLAICCGALMYAELQSDFHFAYVARHTERALPLSYKAAAFWAGQEGSLLLWAMLLAGLASIFALVHRKQEDNEKTVSLGTLAVVIGFFAALMLFAANPFAAADVVPDDGSGMNPMLQDPGMVAHPPILFMGYAGFTIPFALLIGVLVTGRTDSEWLAQARPWVLGSWIFLGAGILLGAQWAYTELGWGGYWAWDPVENASLLPWLTATALLHSAVGQRTRGMFKHWSAVLAALTFILCIFGTYITRSGVVDSVHTFGQSLVGTFFGVFLTLSILVTLGLLAFRWGKLRSQRSIQNLFTREGAFLAGNLIFILMTAITFVGTMFPVITRAITGEPMSVRQSFYNRGVLPLAFALLALMAIVPVLTSGSQTMKKIMRGLGIPLALAAIAVASLWFLGARSVWALATAVMAAVIVGSSAFDVVRGIRARQVHSHENALVAALRVIDGNHRRYGSHIVHTALAMIVIGIAGSSLYNTKALIPLGPGQSTQVGKYTITLDSLKQIRGENYTAVQANVSVTDSRGNVEAITPQRRFYDKAEEANTQIALRSNWSEDLYVTLAGWEEGGKVTTLQVIINPLVRWIWAGGIVLVLGGVWCLAPRIAGGKEVVATVIESKPLKPTITRRSKGKRRRHAKVAVAR